MEGVAQAARYGQRLRLSHITLISFVEYVNDDIRRKYEVDVIDKPTGVTVTPVFVETGQ